MQVALHMDVALAAPVNLLPLPRRAAGHVDQRHLVARDAQSRAEGWMGQLVGQEIRFVGNRKALTEGGERGDGLRPQPGAVHPRAIIRTLRIKPLQLPTQFGELQLFKVRAAETGDLGKQRGCGEGRLDRHAGAKTGRVISGVTSRNWTLRGI